MKLPTEDTLQREIREKYPEELQKAIGELCHRCESYYQVSGKCIYGFIPVCLDGGYCPHFKEKRDGDD
jgi:hypothetical protein